MSYSGALSALKTTLAGVSGIKRVVNGFPPTVQAAPLIYLEADSGDRSQAGQVTSNTYRVVATLCVPFQDNAIAEDQIAPYINTIPAAIDANPTLSHSVNLAWVALWRTDVRAIGGVPGEAANMYRVVDFTISIRDKGSYGGGL